VEFALEYHFLNN